MEKGKCSICGQTRNCVTLCIAEGMMGTNIGHICADCIAKISQKDATEVTWLNLANFVTALDRIKCKDGGCNGSI